MDVDAAISTLEGWLERINPATARTLILETAIQHPERAAAAMSSPTLSGRELRRAAHHEAAHACVALSLGVPVRRAFLGEAYAAVELDQPDPMRDAIVKLAGAALELLAGVDEWRQCALAGSYDLMAAKVAIADSGLTPRAASTAAVLSVTTRLPQISRIGAALLALGALDGREVASLSGVLQ